MANYRQTPRSCCLWGSVAIPNGYLWIGGQTATHSLVICHKVQYTKEKGLTLTDFPALLEPLDNFAATSIGSKVFVAGGNASGKPSNKIYYIDTATDKEWHCLTDFPETASVQPVVAAVAHESDTHLYLLEASLVVILFTHLPSLLPYGAIACNNSNGRK